MNDTEREMWVRNDEGLYFTWKRSGLSMRNFLRKHRKIIDEHINTILNIQPR